MALVAASCVPPPRDLSIWWRSLDPAGIAVRRMRSVIVAGDAFLPNIRRPSAAEAREAAEERHFVLGRNAGALQSTVVTVGGI